ncbi:hypothetical protein BX600DRAFT_263060 [Xylariales sp. PMI_506]|nr:hypothetical protein BX600DRAFT_263060 [Xylariales sp. PMI_506]
MAEKIGVALIGSGIFVKEQHLPSVLLCPDLSLKAIYSRSLKSAQGVAADATDVSDLKLYSEDGGADGAGGYAELLARDDVHAVIIALPIPTQPDFVKRALQAGKHVLCEKPVAKDVATAEDLIAFYHALPAAGSGVKATLSIAEQYRYLNALRQGAREIGQLGRVLSAHLYRHTLVAPQGKYIDTPWRRAPEYQGGFLLDGGVHHVAGLRLLLSGGGVKVRSLSSRTALLRDYLAPVDTTTAALDLDNGAVGSLSISFGAAAGLRNELTVACERGTVTVDWDKVTVTPLEGPPRTEEHATNLGDNSGSSKIGGVATEVFAWAKGIVSGKQDPEQTPEEALADLEFLEALLKSGEKGGAPVELKYQI